MKKLKLEELRVDSFVTSAAGTQRRTVRGYADTSDFGCSHDCNSLPIACSETYTQVCAATCDPYVCSDNPTCPWGYPTCNEDCSAAC